METTSGAGWSYRDADEGLRAESEAHRRRRWAELVELPRAYAAVYGARVGRIAAGMVAVAGMALLVAVAMVDAGLAMFTAHSLGSLRLTLILVGTPLAACVAYLGAARIARGALARKLATDLVPRSPFDLHAALAQLEVPTAQRAAELVDRLERRSVAWFLTGVSLVAPLCMHLLVGLTWLLPEGRVVDAYDTWIRLSLVITAPAHGLLVFLSCGFARDLARWPSASAKPPASGFAIWGWTCIAGLVPGVVLYLIPPALVAVTGLAFIPLTIGLVRRRVLAERELLRARPSL